RDLGAERVDVLAELVDLRANLRGPVPVVDRHFLLFLARTNELEVAAHVEAVAARDVVFVERLFGDRVVLAVDLRVVARREALLRGPADPFAAGPGLARVVAGDLRVLRPHLRVRRAALDVAVVARPPPVRVRRAVALSAVLAALALTLLAARGDDH